MSVHRINSAQQRSMRRLKSIKDKTYKIQIDYIRTLTDKNALNAAKLKLPCVIFTGTFTDITTHENLTTTSGVVVMDIDELPKDSTLEEVKQTICALPYVIFCFLSPTAAALKSVSALIREQSRSLMALRKTSNGKPRKNCTKLWGVSGMCSLRKVLKLNEFCKDHRRLCFVSHDPKLYVNWKASVFAENPRSRHDELIKLALERQTAMEASISGYGYQLTGDPAADSVGIVVSMLESAQSGERHGARLKAGRTAGGYVAGRWVDEKVMMKALMETSDKISDSGKTTRTEKKTIVEAFEKGKLEPIALPDPDVDQSADMGFINRIIEEMATRPIAWADTNFLEQLLRLRENDPADFYVVMDRLKPFKIKVELDKALKALDAKNKASVAAGSNQTTTSSRNISLRTSHSSITEKSTRLESTSTDLQMG